jgi:excisionase family DNA binding protein
MYLTEDQAAALTNRPKRTLQQDRYYRRGIPFIKFGRTVRYDEADIRAYIDACRIQTKPVGNQKVA